MAGGLGYQDENHTGSISRTMVDTEVMLTITIMETTEVMVETNYAGNSSRFGHKRFCNVSHRRYVNHQYDQHDQRNIPNMIICVCSIASV